MEKKSKPEVRFKGIEGEWVSLKLGTIGDVKMCKRIFSNQTSDNDDIPFFKIGTFGKKADAFISKELYQEFRNKYPFPKKGDILISASGTIGRTVVYDGQNAYFQDSNIVWLNNDESKVINKFLYYIYGNLSYESEGGTIQRLYNSIILNSKFSFPTNKTEQQKIGNFFENLDQLITQHQQKHSKLKALKKAMLDKMFPKQGQVVPEIRFKGFEGDWVTEVFANLADLKRGLTYSPSNVTLNTGVKVLRSSNINEDRFVQREDDVFVNYEAINIDFVKENDILITSANGSSRLVGKHAIVNKLDYKAVHGGFMLLASAKNPYFLNACMDTEWYNKFVNQYTAGGGGSIGNLSKSDLEIQIVLVPEESEQKKIGNYFKNLDELIINHDLQITKLQNIKKAFLAKMFI